MSWRRGCRPLMLQELIVKSDFGAMMELITKFDKKMTGLDRHFFRAVEYIRHMKLRYNPEPIIAQYEYGGPFVWILEGIAWKDWLNSPIKRAKDLHCTDTALAAQCLWHLTFYGFTPEEQQANAERDMAEIERQMEAGELKSIDDYDVDEDNLVMAINKRCGLIGRILIFLFFPLFCNEITTAQC